MADYFFLKVVTRFVVSAVHEYFVNFLNWQLLVLIVDLLEEGVPNDLRRADSQFFVNFEALGENRDQVLGAHLHVTGKFFTPGAFSNS